MRVAVDARPLKHPFTGIGIYTKKLLQRLSACGDIELLLYGHTTGAEHPVASVSRPFEGARFVSALVALTRMGAWAKSDRADVFWSPRHHLPFLPEKLPAVTTVHDLVWKIVPKTMPAANRITERLLMPASLRRSTRILVPSRTTANDLQQHFPATSGRVRITPLGCDMCPPDDQTISESHEPYMLFVGGVQPRKNLATVLAAMRLLLESVDSAPELRIVGCHDAARGELARCVARHQLSEHVHIIGTIDEQDLVRLYQGCEFLVAPSWYEGFGLTVLEAQSFGKPAIVSKDNALSELVSGGGLVVNPASASDLANAMATLISRPEEYKRCCASATANAETYDWDDTARLTARALYEASNTDGNAWPENNT